MSSDISDPERPGRGDRRKARTAIDAAYAAGVITATDRARRIERVESAYTKGDLAMLVRDLARDAASAGTVAAGAATAVSASVEPTTSSGVAPAERSLGSAIPPDQLDAMAGKASGPSIDVDRVVSTLRSGDGVARVRRTVVIVVVAFVLFCGLGVASVVGIAFTGFRDVFDSATEQPASNLNLQTAEGWKEWTAAIEQETGTSRVYDAVVYPQYAAVTAVGDEGGVRYVYREGKLDLSPAPVTPETTKPVDLTDVDPELVAGLADRTAELQAMPDYESAYMIVNRWQDDPTIMVYLQQTGKLSRWSIYDFTGEVVGGTPS